MRAVPAVVLVGLIGCSSPQVTLDDRQRDAAGSQTGDDARKEQPTSSASQPRGTTGQVKGTPDLTPTQARRIPPMPPTNVEMKTEGNKAVVSWTPSRLETVTGYRVYRKTRGGEYEPVAQVEEPRFVDTKPPKGTVSYSVAAVTKAGTESSLSEPAVRKPAAKNSAKK